MNSIKEDDEHQFLAQDMCVYCGECKAIIMQTAFTRDGRPLHKMPKKVVTGPEPCEECKKKMRDAGTFFVVEIKDGKPTGNYCVVGDDCLDEEKKKEMDKFRMMLMNHDEYDLLINRRNDDANETV